MSKKTQKLPPAPERELLGAPRRSAPYLKIVKMARFGAFSQKTVGPLSPYLNVVFGRNEAGKSTVAAFVKGVLFGWEEARGSRNTYRPAAAEREGSLIFAEPADPDGGTAEPREWELSRARNADGLKGDASLVADIDKDTYLTMFSLSADELRSLRGTAHVTAKLLTAGSGTGISPAEALGEVERRLSECTSRASAHPNSLVQLAERLAELKGRIAAATEEADRFRHLHREFEELEPERRAMLERIDEVNAEVERLTAARAEAERLDAQLEDLERQRDELREDAKALAAERAARLATFDPSLEGITATKERALRDQIEAMAEERAKYDRSVELASQDNAASTAAYEALQEADSQPDVLRHKFQRSVQAALSVLLPALFVAAGVLVFLHGRQIASLSFTALGIGLVVFALFLALAALVMMFRPSKKDERRAAQERDAHWVMLQDRKKLEACEAARDACAESIRKRLDEAGLAAAEGSLRRARSLLDEAREERTERALLDQRRRALSSRLGSVNEDLEEARTRRQAAFERSRLSPDAPLSAFDEAIARATRRRAALMETSEGMNRRYGELKQTLSQARKARSLDALKLQQQQLLTRQEEAAREFARLLLARRMLQAAIATWEGKSQPEVYRQASRYLKLMTDGRWEKVAMSAEGTLEVTDAAHVTLDPQHLSLGTCQQLYLALRIALLEQAENVGRAIPVLADDILVNFDSRRRAGAARALVELSRTRQVVLFTCHEEVVEALRAADPGLTEVLL